MTCNVVSLLPCLMALITDSRTATLTQWMASSSSRHRRHAVAHDLDEVRQLKGTRQFDSCRWRQTACRR